VRRSDLGDGGGNGKGGDTPHTPHRPAGIGRGGERSRCGVEATEDEADHTYVQLMQAQVERAYAHNASDQRHRPNQRHRRIRKPRRRTTQVGVGAKTSL
jgi:hypothetical protein